METDYAWAAGIIDGEGSVMLSRSHKAKHTVPMVSVTSTTREILEKLRALADGIGSVRAQKKAEAHHKQAYVWTIQYNRALDFLRRIIPYMIEPVKRERAHLLLTQYPVVVRRNGIYDEAALIARMAFDDTFKAIGLTIPAGA